MNKWFSYIIVAFLAGLLGWFLCLYFNKSDDSQYRQAIEELERDNKKLTLSLDSLLNVEKTKQIESDSLQSVLVDLERKIETVKKQKNEKIINVRSLPLDSAVEFLSRELSKED